MVKRYNPNAYTNRDGYGGEWADVSMEESACGQYVKLETYQDETARLKKQVARQKKIVKELQAKIADMYDYKDRSPLK